MGKEFEKELTHIYVYMNHVAVHLELTQHGYPAMKKKKMKALVTHSCPTLCDLMDCSLPSSSVRYILQARILGWVAIPFSRGSSQPRD